MDPSMPDAVRIAAAALIAQEQALNEQEARLREREEELARQEQQVAARLAEKSRQVESLQQQLAAAREQFRHDREQIEEAREEANAARSEAIAERDRLRELRPKFIRRMKRQWAGERKDITRRQGELDRLRRGIDDDGSRLKRDRERLQREQDELQRRAEQEREQLRDEAQAVAEAHARFAEEKRAGLAELDRREREVRELAHATEEARRRIDAERPELEKRCEELRAEARGLEQRVTNARRLLLDTEAKRAALPVPPDATPADFSAIAPLLAELPEADRVRLAEYYERCQSVVRAQAAQVADQRAHLSELYARLTRAESHSHKQHAEAVEEMERLCGEFQDREESLRQRSRDVEAAAERLRQERERVARLRGAAERNAAELAARQSDWNAERGRVAAELEERLNALRVREEALANLFRRWRERRQAEVDQLRRLSDDSITTREAWACERDEFQRRSESLRIAQQALVEQALALEETRREFLKEVKRPELAAKHIERLHRRWESLSAASQRDLHAFRERLVEEDAELRQIYVELERQQEELARRERDLTQKLTELEYERRETSTVVHEAHTTSRVFEQQRQRYEQQLNELRAEIKRLANLLAGDDGAPAILNAA